MGIFPSRLKFSTVKPIYKRGDKSNMTNYRPISLLISFLKIFEKNHLFKNISTRGSKSDIRKGTIRFQK
jgi:hypothetical protein